MKVKFIGTILFLFLCSTSIYSQDYYWYNGSRVNLNIDSTKINVTTAREVNLSNLLREFGITEVKQIEATVNNNLLFSVELPIKEMYNSVVNFLKSRNDIISVSPYFGRPNNSIGTSSFFYIKLHKEDDIELLSNFASERNFEIVEQFQYMPDWYIVSTMDSRINSVEMSNIVYESGLFADVDPAFMFNFRPSCTNEPMFNQLWGLKKQLKYGNRYKCLWGLGDNKRCRH